eukprot:scaffold6934_cov121-Isochrysis_galbana.AAC.4
MIRAETSTSSQCISRSKPYFFSTAACHSALEPPKLPVPASAWQECEGGGRGVRWCYRARGPAGGERGCWPRAESARHGIVRAAEHTSIAGK